MNLLPQDVLVMLKLAVSADPHWTYDKLAHDLRMSPSMAYSAVKRATQARLFAADSRLPSPRAMEEFLIHGVKYAYPPDLGPVSRGVPTAHASPAMRGLFVYDPDGDVYVWPHPEGGVRGVALSPLYKSVPEVAMGDERLYGALGLLDAVRVGRAREQKAAADRLAEMLRHASA